MTLTVNILIGVWLLIMIGFEGSKHNPLKTLMSHWRINRFVSYFGLWHSWSMFAPQPLHSNRNIFARAVDSDGKELCVWTEPDWTVMNGSRQPPDDANLWWHIKQFWVGKFDLFWNMRLRKLFSSCAEGRQWDMPLLLRQFCRLAERHMNRQGIHPDSIALFVDIEYAPYFCPRDGIKDWKASRDMFDQVIYIYECENTTEENATHSDDLNGEIVHLPYSVRWDWKRRSPINGGEEAWVKTLVDEYGNEFIADTYKNRKEDENIMDASTGEKMKEEVRRTMYDKFEERKHDNEFLEEDWTPEEKEELGLEEYVVMPKKNEWHPHMKYGHKDSSNGGSI